MKIMTNQHDYHVFTTARGIFVSIHQENQLREDFGPFTSNRLASQAARKEWMKQKRKANRK
jgi:hypothetical protein